MLSQKTEEITYWIYEVKGAMQKGDKEPMRGVLDGLIDHLPVDALKRICSLAIYQARALIAEETDA